MTRDDIVFWLTSVGAVAAVLSCIYQILERHWPRSTKTEKAGAPMGDKAPSNRPILINLAIALLVWAAIGFGYYDRHNVPPTVTITNWGVESAPGVTAPMYMIIMNTTGIQRFKDDYKVILVARNGSWPNVDPLFDTAIEKSAPFTITGPGMQMAFQGSGKIRYAIDQPNQAQLIVVLLPNDVSPDEFTRMADVKRLGAKVVGSAAQTVVGSAPSTQSIPAPITPH